MDPARDISIGLAGIIASLYGGLTGDSTILVIGFIILFIDVAFIANEMQKEINNLKSQINMHLELRKIWSEIEKIKKRK